MAVYITGVEESLRVLDRAPKDLLKAAKTAIRDGNKAAAREFRAKGDPRWRGLVRAKVGTTAAGDLWSRVGYYNNKVARGHQPKAYRGSTSMRGIVDWFKFYWANYGTLARRDPSHRFDYGVKQNVSSRRNNKGQKPQRWFENAAPAAKTAFERAYTASIQRNFE